MTLDEPGSRISQDLSSYRRTLAYPTKHWWFVVRVNKVHVCWFTLYVQLSNASHSIYRAEGAWRLAVHSVAVAYIATGDKANGALPPLAGWRACEIGVAPAPTLVASGYVQ